MATAYRNFDLLVERRATGYRRAQDSPAGGAVVNFDLPFTADELRSFSWLSSQVSQGLGLAMPGRAPPPLDLRQFGARFSMPPCPT